MRLIHDLADPLADGVPVGVLVAATGLLLRAGVGVARRLVIGA